jgi:hypothetical protein
MSTKVSQKTKKAQFALHAKITALHTTANWGLRVRG